MAYGIRGVRNDYPAVPKWEPTSAQWLKSGLDVRVQGASPEVLREIDRRWPKFADKETDPIAYEWRSWLDEAKGRVERFVVVDAVGDPIAIWLDKDKILSLDVPAYRVDYVMIRPDMRRKGLGRDVVRAVLARAKDLGAARIVFHSTETSHDFWTKAIGAVQCIDWPGVEDYRGAPTRILELNVDSIV